MAKVIPFGQPENESERLAIDYLRKHLPDENYMIYTNLEIMQGDEPYEVDIILLTPHCVYVIDVKGIHGRINIDRDKWYPERSQCYPSPLKKLRKHSKVLKSTILDINRACKELLDKVWVGEAVLLTTDDVDITVQTGHELEMEKIVYLDKQGINFFRNHTRVPSRFTSNIRHCISLVDKAIKGRSQISRTPKFYRDWEIEESLGSTNRYKEYRAKRTTFGVSGLKSRLRVYKVDLFLEPEERRRAFQVISTAFIAVHQIPSHPNILGFQEPPFESTDGEGLIIIYEDIPGQTLSQLIKHSALDLSGKLNIIRDILHGLEHAHKHGVIHRNITPDTVFITTDRQAKVTGFDYARIATRTSTIAPDIAEELEDYSAYQALECYQDPSQASVQSDLFSVGLVFYELLVGQAAFHDVHDLYEREAQLPLSVSELYPDLNPDIDAWLRQLCAFDIENRFQSADDALRTLTPLISLPKPDLRNLPTETILGKRFRVVRRLGQPGSFAVAYKVFDTLGDVHHVLKLITRDRRSLFERVQQEYKILLKVPRHPHIVDVVWADTLSDFDDTPYIVFEYLEGHDLEHALKENSFSIEQVLEFTQQILSGILHLHNHSVYHQDIKPSNILLTGEGIKIIDFNVAVAEADEAAITAGTRRYLPPDLRPTSTPSTEQRIDRDLYALGITLYECITGEYPFSTAQPQLGQKCNDPRVFGGCEDLSDKLVDLLKKAIAPKRSDRFSSAVDFLEAFKEITVIQESSAEDVKTENTEFVSEEKTELATAPVDSPNAKTPDQPLGKTVSINTDADETSSVSPITIQPSVNRAKTSIVAESEKSFPPLPFDLFEVPSLEHLASVDTEKPIILDPSKAYPPDTSRYTIIETEVDWMRNFGISNMPYWVRGKALCNWAEEWLRSWNRTHQIAEIKRSPKLKLAELLQPAKVPIDWSEQQCLAVVMHLEKYKEEPIAQLLAELTNSDPIIWTDVPSPENLARWLAIKVPEEAHILEQAWQAQRPTSELGTYYQTTDKHLLLKQWLGLTEPKPHNLGPYPLPDVPSLLQNEFDDFWKRELCRTQGSILDNLDLSKQSASNRIADTAYKIFRERPDFLTSERKKALKGYITHQHYEELAKYQRPPEPLSLSLEASSAEALQWVTNQYLPLRRWETSNINVPSEKQVCDRLAASFEDWMLKHYPELIIDSVASSWLNYNVSHHVQELCSQEEGAVFWVVVDGLGWLDHQELLALLTDQKQLQLERDLEPRFSILPTKTEYAKWSLYSQLRPGHDSWKDNAGEGFKANSLLTQRGKRYTDKDVTQQRLQKDLKLGKQQLYCWDSDHFDKLFHDEVDWQELYTVQRPRALKAIAEDILRFVNMHPNSETLRVIIASDHGQLMGKSSQMLSVPQDLNRKGRMAIGKADHPQLTVLDKERFDLPHDISIIRGSGSFGSFSSAEDKSIVGCHGGLYPEEVVIGFSVLTRSVKRLPVIVRCSGIGRPGDSGVLKVEVNNPNTISISDLNLVVNQLDQLEKGIEISGTVSAKATQTFDITIVHWPELPPSHYGNHLTLEGQLKFQYQNAERETTELDKDSAIEVKQIFSSGMKGGLDEFF